ncbi:MAG: YraN family protein [bacterium]|nr:YraN family protein [bacterium]
MDKRSKGTIGEQLAIKFLRRHGYKILSRNFRTKTGEIDIIAQDRKSIVFIEVKLRDTLSFGYPSEAVNRTKAYHLQKTALIYLTKNNFSETPYRFEILSILKEDRRYRIEIIPLEI